MDKGILYPLVPGNFHHNYILNPFSKNFDTERIRSICREAKQSKVEYLIFSAEVVSTLPSKRIKQITDCLLECESVSLLVCLRHWKSFLPSRFAQSSRRRDSHTYLEFLEKVSNRAARHWDFDYGECLNNIYKCGHDVKIVSYDNAVLNQGLTSAIFEAAGISNLPCKDLINEESNFNVSCPWEITEFHRLLNGVAADHFREPQNPLFDTLACGNRQSFTVFDFSEILNKLESPWIAEILEWIGMHEAPLPKVPDRYIEIENSIMMRYGSDVTNACNGRLFPENPQHKSRLKFTSLTWPQLLEWNPDLVRQIMERIFTIWSPTESVSPRTSRHSTLSKIATKEYRRLRSH